MNVLLMEGLHIIVIVCFFFSAPLLPSLLTVAPVAAAGPLIALFGHEGSRDQGLAVWGAMASQAAAASAAYIRAGPPPM